MQGTVTKLMVVAGLLYTFLSCPLLRATSTPIPDSFQRLIREAAQVLLKEGNNRFVTGKMQHPNMEAERRHETVTEGQQPFVTILACSDSRDPVELIFDRGIGDLFVVRVAGNIAGISELATVEYGVGHLNTPLLLVMGHTKCGAVTAVVKGAELHGHLPKLAEKIKPAAVRAKEHSTNEEEIVCLAIEQNIWQTIADVLRQSTEVRELVSKGRLQIIGAQYDLETGVVKWLGKHPDEKFLLEAGEKLATSSQNSHEQPSTPAPPPPVTAPAALAPTRAAPAQPFPARLPAKTVAHH